MKDQFEAARQGNSIKLCSPMRLISRFSAGLEAGHSSSNNEQESGCRLAKMVRFRFWISESGLAI
jgi:hypothetical protein